MIVAALGLGVAEQYSGFVLGAQFQQATVVGLLLAILIWRQLAPAPPAQGAAMTRRSLAPAPAAARRGVVAAPFLFPAHAVQFAVFWIIVLFALTWDTMGGQMGYNSLGNILFFGFGMYVCAVTQIGLVYNVAEYTAANGAIKIDFTDAQYFQGLALGLVPGRDRSRRSWPPIL